MYFILLYLGEVCGFYFDFCVFIRDSFWNNSLIENLVSFKLEWLCVILYKCNVIVVRILYYFIIFFVVWNNIVYNMYKIDYCKIFVVVVKSVVGFGMLMMFLIVILIFFVF